LYTAICREIIIEVFDTVRYSLSFLLIGMLVFGFAACGRPDVSEDAVGDPRYNVDVEGRAPEEGDWLVAHLEAEMEHLNPFTSTDAYSSDINALIIERLLDMDNETFEIMPLLAESWEVSDDHLTYTFRLRENLWFSDGHPLTSEDVKFSFDTITDPTTDAPHVRHSFQDVIECRVIDERTVQFTCNKPYFRHLLVLGGLQVIPKHIYSVGDFNTHANNRNPIGSGKYVLESWTTGQQLTLARNENYWGEKPPILKRMYKIITNNDAALQVLLRQDLDMIARLGAEQWVHQTATPQFHAHFNKVRFPSPGYTYIGWNMRRPQFQDKMVRRALTMLLDRELLAETIYYGLATVATGTFLPLEPENNPAIEPWPFDPDEADRLLDAAGWIDTDRDGIRDKDGRPFRFELLLTADNPAAEQIATIFQERLAAHGIDMRLRQLEWATMLQSIQEHEFDACTLAWRLVPYPDPYQLWHSSQTGKRASNSVGFVHAEADRIMEEARLEFDRDKRVEMYHRFHEILHEEQPYTFVVIRDELVAIHRRFHNTQVYPYGMDSTEWWVPRELQKFR
jgi:peptide/nickel transport system substrate-binding protein